MHTASKSLCARSHTAPCTNLREKGEKKENEENLALAVGFDPEMSNYFSIPYAQNRENYARTKSCGTNDQAQMTPFEFTAYLLIWGTDTNFQQAMRSCLMPPSPSSYLL